ncbi:rCG63335 [Rattus norvegicus]|uniref:RCG63116 n=1 Tax=Rattus norvegicus TaxID=10116 RepID=A6K3B2_RAT|nr:rCG63116 [Rattus norvegicus]EDL86007.1 rCG63118 [Rattus norvegicus]EDL88863.1 rCG63168 [Rattus norvegicus]EDL95675.1 rCG63278 [Rattus norvegicus]EDL97932.1 rCG63335 [Rattus norvegicus]
MPNLSRSRKTRIM